MAQIQNIFEALVPENIKNIPLIETAMKIFIQNLEENSSISWDIKKIYSSHINSADSDILANSKTNLRKGLLEVYLQALYGVIKDAQGNQELRDKLEITGLNGHVVLNNPAESILGQEYTATHKAFKESVGTLSSINFAHSIAREMESNPSSSRPVLTKIKPFHFLIDGPLSSEMYANIVAPLSHPLGFTYLYRQAVEESLTDLFGLIKIFNIKAIEARSSKGMVDVFVADISNVLEPNRVKDDLWSSFQDRINIKTGAVFTREEYDLQITVHEGKVVTDIREKILDNFNLRKGREVEVLFADGTRLIQQPSAQTGTEFILVHYLSWLKAGEGIIKNFSPTTDVGHYSLFTDFTYELEFDYNDTIEKFEIDFNITAVNDSGTSLGITYLDHNSLEQPIDTSDHVIMTSPFYVREDFTSFIKSLSGLHLSSEDPGGLAYYMTTSDSGGMFKTTDSGLNWISRSIGIPSQQIRHCAIDPINTNNVYICTWREGIFKSTDAGLNWSPINTGILGMAINTLAIDPNNPSILFAGSFEDGVYRSGNSGATWVRSNTGLLYAPITDITIGTTSNVIYATTWGKGIFKSNNSGATWSSIGSVLITHCLVKSTANTIYAGTNNGVSKSTDGGVNWVSINTGLSALNVNAIAVDPLNSNIVYAGTTFGGMFKSTNAGATWVQINNRMGPYFIKEIAINYNNSAIIYISTRSNGVWKTVDAGLNWFSTAGRADQITSQTIAMDPIDPATIYFGTGDGYYMTMKS